MRAPGKLHRVLVVAAALASFAPPALAYLDPSTGSMILSAIVGLAARRNLRAGVPLRAGDVEPPKLVTRNQLVTVVFSMPGITLTTQGRALADGADGETISVLNVSSNRIVQAVVEERGLVAVGTDSTRMAMR